MLNLWLFDNNTKKKVEPILSWAFINGKACNLAKGMVVMGKQGVGPY